MCVIAWLLLLQFNLNKKIFIFVTFYDFFGNFFWEYRAKRAQKKRKTDFFTSFQWKNAFCIKFSAAKVSRIKFWYNKLNLRRTPLCEMIYGRPQSYCNLKFSKWTFFIPWLLPNWQKPQSAGKKIPLSQNSPPNSFSTLPHP